MSRLDKIRRALDWAHHAYWIGELLISLGIGKRVQALITKRFSVSPEWSLPLWLIISGLVFFVVAWAASRVVKKGTQTRDAAQTNEPPVSNVPIAVGLTFEFAEVEIRPEEGYKFKLRVYLANHSGVTTHLGVPIWTEGIAPQGGHLTYFYQARQQNNQQNPWGDQVKELDVSAGQRCRIWLGLDPARSEEAFQLLDTAGLGLLIIPVSTKTYAVNVRIRPSDRGLRRVAAKEYDALKKAIYDRYMLLSQQAKALLSFLRVGRFASTAEISSFFERYHLPIPEPLKVVSGLNGVPMPFVVVSNGDVTLNPILEQIIVEIVRQDDSDFIALVKQLPTATLQDRSNKEPGFKGRYEYLTSRQPL